ncbi:YifB family Mg chelatase-like AAA ATPase [Caldimonas thermodepolymerans]|uniref:ATP-dependent protease n=1 Tax=Caldimonas thermodepolymerans TaxID=215580 RepID=A0A2S5T7N2_9BURK|nr:YifB family Mg chelatase-like AAA ATPase [Caldimonas thermodepolymerans]PPE71005.1 ATP-dependent protease [Caldimonas thermodepolymerans]QPC31305.1 YifB family Mg chelatase-like AAA ATPase [Caldimonas thermodepolymerans]RDH99731.1 magnesium chelatase family protein [Caldimonas thermodepolymerans]TCP07543.1 magnesium chelatase family protein [Caldimonas thermodepolymerans]UZG44049.1 YifB family Mg chelatase-like AAA ATPase [Caldimonas thermodepolymerans]
MSLAVIRSRALAGLQAPEVTVEVHLANGLPSFTLVGLADTEVKEARERVRASLLNSGLEFPHNKRITVNLAPADLPKESGRFDLPIALGILAASGQIDPARLAPYEFAGELSLAGDLRPVRGALAMSLALHRQGVPRALVLPLDSAREASLVQHAEVYGARHLLDVVQALLPPGEGSTAPEAGWVRMQPPAAQPAPAYPDLRDVKGQAGAKRALEIAAAGGHSLLMVGPPGTGKSMLAQRFAGLLPPLDTEAALESAAVLSLAGLFAPERWRQRVFRAPHHSASPVALVGGGSPPRPGEISLAHHGVLFLDELPEFARPALEALREPLETGQITISRAARQAEFPARFQLIAAMNPCPCGYLGSRLRACRCGPDAVARYQARLSGPLLDRIDLQVEVTAVPPEALMAAPDGEPSAAVAARVARARERQQARQDCTNAQLAGAALDTHCTMEAQAAGFLRNAAARLGWSGRSLHRVLKVARTIADLAGSERIDVPHLAEAIQLRRALPGAGPG